MLGAPHTARLVITLHYPPSFIPSSVAERGSACGVAGEGRSFLCHCILPLHISLLPYMHLSTLRNHFINPFSCPEIIAPFSSPLAPSSTRWLLCSRVLDAKGCIVSGVWLRYCNPTMQDPHTPSPMQLMDSEART